MKSSELEDRRAQLVSCCFLNCLAWKKCSSGGGDRGSGAHLSSYCCEQGRWEELNVQHGAQLCHREMGHEQRWENGPFLAWPKSATFPPWPFIYLFCHVWVCVCPSLQMHLSHHVSFFFFFFSTCAPFHHRSGISSLWSVWRYWLVTQARCCVCSMTRGSSSPGRLTRLSGTHLILAPRSLQSARFWEDEAPCTESGPVTEAE